MTPDDKAVDETQAEGSTLRQVPLAGLHAELGAKLVPFAGWEMPVQYKGVMAEHTAARSGAGLFDVSHMGQVRLIGAQAAHALERVVPQAVVGLPIGHQRYAFFTNEDGGLIDDLIVTPQEDGVSLVVNASRVEADLAHLRTHLPDVEIVHVRDRALLALQGPEAGETLGAMLPETSEMVFMDFRVIPSTYGDLFVSRAGYTGEDGFEISVPAEHADALARALLANGAVPCGLGARDSLRLEAGLCLYGSDIDAGTSPIEASLTWAIQKVRRAGGARAGGFPGADRILDEIKTGTKRRRVGLRPEGRAPMRAGVQLFETESADEPVGHVTSGTFGPTVGAPVAMGYVPTARAAPGTRLFGEVRGKRLPVIVGAMPFHPHGYKR